MVISNWDIYRGLLQSGGIKIYFGGEIHALKKLIVLLLVN